MNYRASFWEGREVELRDIFSKIASMVDILIGNEEDFQLTLGIKGPEAVGSSLADKIEGFTEVISRVKADYLSVKMFGTTLRQVYSANTHLWGAILHADGQWFVEEPREIPVLDRIDGGDGFSGGVLYGVHKGWEPVKCL